MTQDFSILNDIFEIIQQRKSADPNESYVARLNQKGLNSILQKIGEESYFSEVILAAKDKDKKETVYETVDLFFHLLVMLKILLGFPKDIAEEFNKRKIEELNKK